jgi:serine protease Do
MMNFSPVVKHSAARCLWMVTASSLALAAALVALPAAAQSGRELPDFTELVERVGPTVVNIRTLEKRGGEASAGGGGGEIDEQMREFFKRFGIPIPDRMPNMPGQPRRGGPQPPQNNPPPTRRRVAWAPVSSCRPTATS